MQTGDLVKLIPSVAILNACKVLGIVVEVGPDESLWVQWFGGQAASWEVQELIEVVSAGR